MSPLTASASGVVAWGAANAAGDGVRIRSGPGLDHDILTQVGNGEVIVIVERTSSEWHKVNYHGTVGYVSVALLERPRQAVNFTAVGSIVGESVNKRSEPNTTSATLATHSSGTVMSIAGINNGWYKVEHGGTVGYVRSDLMTILSSDTAISSAPNQSSVQEYANNTADAVSDVLPSNSSASGIVAFGAANAAGEGIRIRSGPGLEHSVLAQVRHGEVIVILSRTNNEWHKVNFHGTIGYVSVPLLERPRQAVNFTATGAITGGEVNLRARPEINSTALATHRFGTVMSIIGINNGWYKVEHSGIIGYVRSDFMTILSRDTVAALGATDAYSASADTTPAPNRTLGQQIADYGSSFVGTRYVWGGTSPAGFDCSGLVTYVYRHFGISVSRRASEQFRNNGVSVSRANLVPGDLVFFSSNGNSVTHVGIYIGGARFVHASNSRVGVVISNLDSAYYRGVWFGARRLV